MKNEHFDTIQKIKLIGSLCSKWSKILTKGRIAGADFSRGNNVMWRRPVGSIAVRCSCNPLIPLLIFCSVQRNSGSQCFSVDRTTHKNCPLPFGDLVPWAHSSLSSNRYFDRFSRLCRAHERHQQTDTQTDRPRYFVCSNRLHLAIAVMQPVKTIMWFLIITWVNNCFSCRFLKKTAHNPSGPTSIWPWLRCYTTVQNLNVHNYHITFIPIATVSFILYFIFTVLRHNFRSFDCSLQKVNQYSSLLFSEVCS